MGICGSKTSVKAKNVYVDGLLTHDMPMDFKINIWNLRGKGLVKVVPGVDHRKILRSSSR